MELPKLHVADLPEPERNVLEQFYGGQMSDERGYSPNHIVYVRELSATEKSLFSHTLAIQPVGAILQNLYKLKGKLSPARFSRAVNQLTAAEDALRMNYCSVGGRLLAVVLKERQQTAPVVFRNIEGVDGEELDATLRRIMDADLRQGFDSRSGCLVRFSVLHTKQDEYAVLVTAVQAVLTNFNVRQVFAMAMDMPWKSGQMEMLVAQTQSHSMAASVRDYWRKILDHFPGSCQIPQYMPGSGLSHKQRAYVARVPANILSDLRLRARSNKRMLMSILQTAWGFLLQLENSSQDVGYCLLVPRREQADCSLGNVPSLVPVRLQVQGNPTVQELVTKAFQQFVISQPYANMGREDIEEILGQENEAFDHFLNFCDFFCESRSFSEVTGTPAGKLVMQNSWDGRDSKLGISFRLDDHQLIFTMLYGEENFPGQNMKLLVQKYLLVLQQMLTDWNATYADFMLRLQQRLQMEVEDGQADSQNRAVLQDYLSRLTLLQECDHGIIQLFMDHAKLSMRFEGDRIAEDEIEENLIFLVSGRMARSIETGDGWYYTLDIQKENSWLNETALLPDRKNRMAAEVLTEQAVILSVALPSASLILEKSPLLAKNIIKHISKQMEKYQRLWIQS